MTSPRIVTLLSLILVIAACGGDSGPTSPAIPPSSPTPTEVHLDSLTPSVGAVGTEVRLFGSGLFVPAQLTRVLFSGFVARLLSVQDTLLEAEVPVGASSGPTVVVVGSDTSNALPFTVTDRLNVEEVAHQPFRLTDIWVDGDIAYLGSTSGVVRLFDVSNPAQPLLLSTIQASGQAFDVKAQGGLAVVANEPSQGQGGGIDLLDVSDPANPQFIRTFAAGLQAGVHNVFLDLERSLAYLALNKGSTKDFRILDVSDPANPVELGSFGRSPFRCHDMWVDGDIAYLCYFQDGLRVLDVSDPRNPREIGSFSYLNAFTHSAMKVGNRLYITDETDPRIAGSLPRGGLRILDVTNPANPLELGFIRPPLGTSAHNPFIDGTTVYLAAYEAGLRVIDASDPTRPREVGYFITGPNAFAWGASFHRGHILVSDLNTGFWSLRFVPPTAVSIR